MTHEPECRSFDGGHICICDVIRPAYQRGRDDASRAVGELQPFNTFWLAQHEAVDAAAARGDGAE